MKIKKALLVISVLLLGIVSAAFVMPKAGTKISDTIVPDVLINRFLPWKLGLDLAGGSALVYDIDLSQVPKADQQSVLNGLKSVIENRVNIYGVAEPRVRVIEKGEKRQLLVELAGEKDLGEAIKQIGETPTLDFRENCTFTEQFVACTPTELTGRFIKKAEVTTNSTGVIMPVVSLEFNDEGARLFEEITGRNVGKPLAIFLDGQPIDAPVVEQKIIGGKAQISGGDITMESAHKLVERFNAGALSAPITLVNQRIVNASAAGDSLNKIVFAGAVGLLLVVLFMLISYRSLGFIASLALVFYIFFTLAIFKVTPGFAMSLAGITGFILSIGSAVDANILIFERAKEEMRRGTSRKAAIESGFKFAWSSIRDSNINTIITSVILYSFTSSFVKGFALTLVIGIIVNLAVTFTVTRILLRALVRDKKAVVVAAK
ncbi:MAG: protein translocase subunit SecD [Candidatus Colwellbacteria bacterium]|nr:protein translocase subunit SecD [Candidatus Colwellbacteria bacterium]